MTPIVAVVLALTIGASAQEAPAPKFLSAPTILVRSPDPMKIAPFYEALGFKKVRVSGNGGVIFHLEGSIGSLEIVKMDPNTKPAMGKTSRTQQDVVVVFETDNQDDVVRRARANGATVIEKWTAADRPVAIWYIGDPENNILGFAPRHHNDNLKTP
jgi:predicted enzyme related to lactoylglutathione lyase